MKRKLINILLLLLAPILAVLHVFLSMNIKPGLVSMLMFLSLASLLFGLILSLNAKNIKISILGLMMLIVTLIINMEDVSSKIFLGDEIAIDYVAESPGYTEVRLYGNSKSTVKYGGIFGATDVFYLDYYIEGDTIVLISQDSSITIMNNSIEMDGKKYDLKLKNAIDSHIK